MEKKKIKVRKWLRDQLNNKWRMGYGRSKNKGVHNETPYIHSENTNKTYLAQCNQFAGWCMANGIKYADEAYEKVPEYGKWMVEKGIRLLGVDVPSVDAETSKELPTHMSMSRNGRFILEGIVLDDVEAGVYELIALPLKIKGAEGSPVRAVLYR